MSLYLKVVLIIFGLAYLISPVDIIPDLLVPYIGWLDDGALIAALIYLIRTGKLPNFIFKRPGRPNSFKGTNSSGSQAKSNENKGYSQGKSSQNRTNSGAQSSKQVKSPYEILGLSPGASKKQIQAAYKEAIKKYHPDKLSHLGEEFSNLANEKFLEIQDAYDLLMKS